MSAVFGFFTNLYDRAVDFGDRHFNKQFTIPAPSSAGPSNADTKFYTIKGSVSRGWGITLDHEEDFGQGKYHPVPEKTVVTKQGESRHSTIQMLAFCKTHTLDRRSAIKTIEKFERNNERLLRRHSIGLVQTHDT